MLGETNNRNQFPMAYKQWITCIYIDNSVLTMSTGSPAQDQKIFQFLFRTTFVYKNKFKNLIWTSKSKFSFRELD